MVKPCTRTFTVPYGMGTDARFHAIAGFMAWLTGYRWGRVTPDEFMWYRIEIEREN